MRRVRVLASVLLLGALQALLLLALVGHEQAGDPVTYAHLAPAPWSALLAAQAVALVLASLLWPRARNVGRAAVTGSASLTLATLAVLGLAWPHPTEARITVAAALGLTLSSLLVQAVWQIAEPTDGTPAE